ncbi:hypothetical protein ACMFMG_002165 [Clarireedia jacksonii]
MKPFQTLEKLRVRDEYLIVALRPIMHCHCLILKSGYCSDMSESLEPNHHLVIRSYLRTWTIFASFYHKAHVASFISA